MKASFGPALAAREPRVDGLLGREGRRVHGVLEGRALRLEERRELVVRRFAGRGGFRSLACSNPADAEVITNFSETAAY